MRSLPADEKSSFHGCYVFAVVVVETLVSQCCRVMKYHSTVATGLKPQEPELWDSKAPCRGCCSFACYVEVLQIQTVISMEGQIIMVLYKWPG